jgi:hypothetical protein
MEAQRELGLPCWGYMVATFWGLARHLFALIRLDGNLSQNDK